MSRSALRFPFAGGSVRFSRCDRPVRTAAGSGGRQVKVGFVSTLSGPSAGLGVDIRDGFLLAVKLSGQARRAAGRRDRQR